MAGSVIGALRVNLGLDSAKFSKGLKQSQGRMQTFARRVAKIGAAVSVASAGVTLAIRQQVNAADRMSKDSQKLGVPIEQLSALRHAADMSGVSSSELDTALGRLARTMDDAEQGGKKSAALFERLGVKVSGADGKLRPMSDVMADVAGVLGEMPDGAEKSALAIELFGRSGAALIPMLNSGKDGLQGMIDEARELGLVIDKDTGKAAENFNDNLSRLAKTVKGVVIQAMAAMAPVLERISDAAVEMSKHFRNLSPVMQQIVAGAAAAVAVAGPLALGLGAVLMAVKPLVAGIGLLLSPIGLAVAGFAALVVGAVWVVRNWEELKARFPILQKAADFGKRIAEAWSDLPAIKWALLIPALRWARFIPGLRWAAFLPKIAWVTLAGGLKWTALIGKLAWGAMRFIPVIGWAALAGTLAWKVLVKRIEWDGWIPRVVWADWVPKLNWDGFLEPINWNRYMRGQKQAAEAAAAAHMESVGRDIGNGLRSGLMSTMPDTADATRDYMNSIEDAARDETETQSPSRVWARLGKDLTDGLAVGIEGGAGSAVQAMLGVSDQLTGAGRSITEGFRQIGQEAGQAFSGMSGHFDGLITGGKKFSDVLKGIAGQFESRFWDQLFSGGFRGMGGGVGGKGKGLLGLGGFLGFLDGGGDVGAGQWAVAGERRPELVTGPSIVRGPAKVIGGDETARMMQGGGTQAIEVRVIGGDLTLTDDGTIAARIRVTAAQSGEQALQQVKASLPGWQDQLEQRGTLT